MMTVASPTDPGPTQVGTYISWFWAFAVGVAWIPVRPSLLAGVLGIAAVMTFGAVLTRPLFTVGVWLGERDHWATAVLATALCLLAAWTLPALGPVARWRIQILANISWLSHQLRWDRVRVWAGEAQIRRARVLSARRPDQTYLLAHALTMESCRYAAGGRFDIALLLARQAVAAFATFDGVNHPDHAYAARHIATHVHDWERGIRSSH